MFENLPRLDGTARVEFTINGSSIVVELFGDDAPITAGNFVDLVQRDIYDGLAFHRVIRDPNPFVVQGGDPQGADLSFPVESLGNGGFIDPNTGRERVIPLEVKLQGDDEPTYSTLLGRQGGISSPDVVLSNQRGSIAMARSTVDSASSQFYFNLSDDNTFLDGDFAAFGDIVEGLDVIDTIEQGDRITDAEVIEGSENLIEGIDTVDLFRFRNTTFNTGTYLFADRQERDAILDNPDFNQIFELEGDGNIAFAVALETRDDLNLVPFFRLRSLDIQGTYLYVGSQEYDNIFAENSNQRDRWEKEGLNDETGEDIPDFYLYEAGAGQGIVYNRFQNNFNNTFLFTGPEETAAIESDPNLSAVFTNQGVAFEALDLL